MNSHLVVIYTKIEAAMPDPFKGTPIARLEYVTRGIKKHEANKTLTLWTSRAKVVS